MARSHICPRCGQELSGTTARLGVVVAQPVVVCPRCASGWARATRPRRNTIRDARRAMHATTVLAGQTALALILAVACVTMAHSLARSAVEIGPSSLSFGLERDDRWVDQPVTTLDSWIVVAGHRFHAWGVIVFAFVAVCAAGWSSIACAHRRTLRAWGDWLAILAAVLACFLVVHAIEASQAQHTPRIDPIRVFERTAILVIAIVCVSSLPILAAAPVRASFRRARARTRRARQRSLIRKTRARRRGHP